MQDEPPSILDDFPKWIHMVVRWMEEDKSRKSSTTPICLYLQAGQMKRIFMGIGRYTVNEVLALAGMSIGSSPAVRLLPTNNERLLIIY